MAFLSDRYHFKRWYKRLAVFIFDSAGSLIFFLGRCKEPLKTAALKRVLFVRLDQIGDIAMILPALRAFKEAFPQTVLDVLTTPEGAELLRNENLAGTVIIFKNHWFRKAGLFQRWGELTRLKKELRKNNYDAAVDFRGDLRIIQLLTASGIPERIGYPMTGGRFMLTRVGRYWGDMHQVHLNRALLGFFGINSEASEPVPFQVSEEETRLFWNGAGKTISRGTKPLIVIHAGAGRPEKTWETLKFRRLTERMLKDKLGHLVLIGAEAERGAFGEIKNPHDDLTDLRGGTSLRDLLVLLASADIFIGGDSGPAHLAAAQGARVVSIFKGPNCPESWHPWAKKLYLVKHPEPCPSCGRKLCQRRKRACLETISAKLVYRAVLEAWRDAMLHYPMQPAIQPGLEEF